MRTEKSVTFGELISSLRSGRSLLSLLLDDCVVSLKRADIKLFKLCQNHQLEECKKRIVYVSALIESPF